MQLFDVGLSSLIIKFIGWKHEEIVGSNPAMGDPWMIPFVLSVLNKTLIGWLALL